MPSGDPAVTSLLSMLPEILAETEHFVVEAFLLRSDADTVRLVVGDLCLDVATDDVVKIEETAGAAAGFAVGVTVTLKVGAALLGLAPAAFYRTLINEPVQPFSYAVRPEPPQLLKSARFVTMEAEFRRRNALE